MDFSEVDEIQSTFQRLEESPRVLGAFLLTTDGKELKRLVKPGLSVKEVNKIIPLIFNNIQTSINAMNKTEQDVTLIKIRFDSKELVIVPSENHMLCTIFVPKYDQK